VHTPDVGLEAVEVAGEHEVEPAVAVDVVGQHGVHRGDLRLVGERRERERAVAGVARHGRREGERRVDGGAGELGRREHLGERLSGVRLVAQVARLERGQPADQVVAHEERVLATALVRGEDLLGDAVTVEILDEHAHRRGGAGLEPAVQTQVAEREVDPPVAVEVGRDHAIPPAVAALEAGRGRAREAPVAGVVEDGDGHPLAHHDQVGAPVAVDVGPRRVGDHTGAGEAGSELPRRVGEAAAAVVDEEHARPRHAVRARGAAAADEQVDVAVAVVVRGGDARAAARLGGERADRLAEAPAARVEVEPVLERRRAVGEVVPAAHHVQVGATVAVGVEEHGAHVLGDGVGLEQAGVAAHEAAVTLLDEQLAGLLLGAPEVEVVEPVAVHVGHRGRRPLGRQHARQQALAVEVDEVAVLPVHERHGAAIGHVGEHRTGRRRRWRRGRRRRGRGGLSQSEHAVGRLVAHDAGAPVGPRDHDRVDARVRAEAEGEPVVAARQEAARGRELLHELLAAGVEGDARAHAEAVGPLALEAHAQGVPVLEQRAGVIAVDERLAVDVVDDEVDGAVAVEVPVGGAAREARHVEPPRPRVVGEAQPAARRGHVAEGVVRDRRRIHRLRQAEEVDLAGARLRDLLHLVWSPGTRRSPSLGCPSQPLVNVDVLATDEVESTAGRSSPVGGATPAAGRTSGERAAAVVPLQHVPHRPGEGSRCGTCR
jgi:hypothetical protein